MKILKFHETLFFFHERRILLAYILKYQNQIIFKTLLDMKKYFTLLLLAIFGLTVVSCVREKETYIQDNDTYPVVLDITNANFMYNVQYGYHISRSFTKPLVDTDIVLIYRRVGSTNGSPVWQSIPITFYLDNGKEFDYNFDFSKYNIMIYANGNYDITTTPQFMINQTFRVVLIPASYGGKNTNIDYSDYNSVIKYFNIDDSKIKKL